METKETALISKNMFGNQPYQLKARLAMPLLVRQAAAKHSIFYEQLAGELGMPNPRNLNFPLGSVGQTLIELGNKWDEKIPPIQCLVVNQSEGMPGDGFGWFMPKDVKWKRLTKLQRRNLTEGMLQQIYAYPKWDAVLAALNLEPAIYNYSQLLAKAAHMGGVGEGEAHKRLKAHVSQHPDLVGVPKRLAPGRMEERLPSGDSIDVYFEANDEWIAVEVKPASSDPADLTRGLYQCVKYRAVLAAVAVARRTAVATRAVLVIGGVLPPDLVILRTMLGIEVIEGINP